MQNFRKSDHVVYGCPRRQLNEMEWNVLILIRIQGAKLQLSRPLLRSYVGEGGAVEVLQPVEYAA